MDWPPRDLEFNTKQYDKYRHIIEYTPEEDITIKLCRCWQSRKFPYCDDTHKQLMEAGDNVGPYVVWLQGAKRVGGETENALEKTSSRKNALEKTSSRYG